MAPLASRLTSQSRFLYSIDRILMIVKGQRTRQPSTVNPRKESDVVWFDWFRKRAYESVFSVIICGAIF